MLTLMLIGLDADLDVVVDDEASSDTHAHVNADAYYDVDAD